MKRVVKEFSKLTNRFNYTIGGYPFKYSIRDNSSNSPDSYKAVIVEHHPYSEAEYVWARIGYREPMSVEYIQNGEVIEYEPGHRKEFRFDWRDFYEDADEYIREMVERVCEELRDYNRNIESIIGYD